MLKAQDYLDLYLVHWPLNMHKSNALGTQSYIDHSSLGTYSNFYLVDLNTNIVIYNYVKTATNFRAALIDDVIVAHHIDDSLVFAALDRDTGKINLFYPELPKSNGYFIVPTAIKEKGASMIGIISLFNNELLMFDPSTLSFDSRKYESKKLDFGPYTGKELENNP